MVLTLKGVDGNGAHHQCTMLPFVIIKICLFFVFFLLWWIYSLRARLIAPRICTYPNFMMSLCWSSEKTVACFLYSLWFVPIIFLLFSSSFLCNPWFRVYTESGNTSKADLHALTFEYCDSLFYSIFCEYFIVCKCMTAIHSYCTAMEAGFRT